MFSFGSKKLHDLKLSVKLSTCLLPIRISYIWFSSNATESPSLTVDYLIHRCGFTQESAVKASQKMNIKSAANADSVLAFLNSYELTKPYISKIIRKYPRILSADPKKTFVRIEILSSMGFSGADLGKILTKDPALLSCVDLENEVAASMKFLKRFLHDDKSVIAAFTRLRWIKGMLGVMEPNIEILRSQGVTGSGISKLILRRPQLLTWKPHHLSEIVLQAKEMGFDPSRLMFIVAISTLSQMNKATLEAKRDIFRSFGWSEDEILCMFRKQPGCLLRSEETLRNRLDFFMNKLGLTAAEINTLNPVILLYSMENRTMPRCSVIQVLLSRGLMKKQSIGNALILNEDRFLENFVWKYQQELPQLITEYKHHVELRKLDG